MTAKVKNIKSKELTFDFDTCDEVSAVVKAFTLVDWRTKVDWTTNRVTVYPEVRKK